MASLISIAILLIIVTVSFAYMAVRFENKLLQIFLTLLTMLMIVADFRIVAMITEAVDLTQIGLISHLNTFYFIGIQLLRFFLFLALLTAFLWLVNIISNWNKIKRRIKEESFIGY